MPAQATKREAGDRGERPVPVESARAARERKAERAKPSPRPPEVELLLLSWHAAIVPPNLIPPHEDVALGGLGRLADSAALIHATEPDQLDILLAGPVIEAWIDHPTRRVPIDGRSTGRIRTLHDAVSRAVRDSRPAEAVAHAVVNGLVCSYDVIALPLSNRWGPPLCQVYIKERPQKYSLVDAIFRATDDGVVALAVMRDNNQFVCDFQIVALNDGAARLMRGGAEELRGRRLSETFVNLGRDGALASLFGVAENGGSARFEVEADFGAGEETHLSVNASAMGDLVAVTMTDISDIKAREASFRQLFDGSPTPTALCHPDDFRFIAVNEAAAALWGFSRQDLLAMTAYDVTLKDDWDVIGGLAAQDPAAPAAQRNGRQQRADGSLIDVVIHARSIIFPQSIAFRDRPAQLLTIVDVTEKHEAEQRIAHMARHDALTDLPNRALFRERLDEALGRLRADRGGLGVFYLDLDQFKAINDTLGHAVGDMLLRAVADRLRASLRPADVVARFGGDEFAVFRAGLNGPDKAGALA